MQNKTDKSNANSYTTLLGVIFFITFNLILLTLVAWLVLTAWFVFHSKLSLSALFIVTVKLIFVRCKLFLIKSLFILLILIACAIDGLVCRDIRKYQCARESAFLFHRLKPLVSMVFYLIFFCYMASPVEFNSEHLFILMACCSGVFIKFSIEYFKKYV